jgi:hypothetical protein
VLTKAAREFVKKNNGDASVFKADTTKIIAYPLIQNL